MSNHNVAKFDEVGVQCKAGCLHSCNTSSRPCPDSASQPLHGESGTLQETIICMVQGIRR